ncbi:hypothetical protein [Acinetobacter baumannii]|uniref:hypothetical protein n=1 Tax=Acinetobacter baumannii TaxID=470 RepID=UPI0002DE450A
MAQDIPDGAYVNLGIGLPPRLPATYLLTKMSFYILKMACWLLAPTSAGEEDPELINAVKSL